MTVNAIDRRSQATRDAIGKAFLKLGGMRELDRLRVGDLASEAGIARSTFYAHYRGLDDYLARSFAAMLGQLARHEPSEAILPVRDILAHIDSAGEGARRLAASDRFRPMLVEGELALRRVAAERLARRLPTLDAIERRSIATILAAGFMAMLRDGLQQPRSFQVVALAARFEAVELRIAGPGKTVP